MRAVAAPTAAAAAASGNLAIVEAKGDTCSSSKAPGCLLLHMLQLGPLNALSTELEATHHLLQDARADCLSQHAGEAANSSNEKDTTKAISNTAGHELPTYLAS